ncbi:MarR family transcriptional regulator [Streptomyces sp. WAC 01529]|uniref:MarR family winged helix-turn-helix transcriptional regulator n=1 Tax=Streptomyces sp. WAC 01529 TaxID=2203205 RepID=UPI000F71A035|nr:MarR family transcriptional regulator [Streptomyces sp. WAC 01529]AZM56911.1 MarR family transcriptional regulator [Streptomyces sp. WAC 01529]
MSNDEPRAAADAQGEAHGTLDPSAHGTPDRGAPDSALDVEAFTSAIEDFNRFYIRLPVLEKLPFTTLSVLDTLAFGGSPRRLTELTKTEQVSQPGITQLVTRLERDGLVERRPDPSDGRGVLVHITEAGREIGRSRRADRARHLRPLLDQLAPEQRRAIADALPALTRLAELGRARSQTAGTPSHGPASRIDSKTSSAN